MEKECIKCKELKEEELFVPVYNKEKQIIRTRNTCKQCFNKQREEQRKKNPTENRINSNKERWKRNPSTVSPLHKRAYNLKKKYGMSLEDFDKIRQEQDAKCKICNQEKFLVVDHCHSSGRVRGLLCSSCNTAIGLLKDDVDILQKAINYLQKDLDNTL